jgi:hypothetical protein
MRSRDAHFDALSHIGTVGTRSRAIRGSTFDARVACSASDGRCAPARPALHVSTRPLPFLLYALASADCIRPFRLIIAPYVNFHAGRAGNQLRSKALHRMSLSDNQWRFARERVPYQRELLFHDFSPRPPLEARQNF